MTKVKPMTPAQIVREIKRRNRLFKEASPEKKRVLIAKDVIAQLNAKRLVSSRGRFMESRELLHIQANEPTAPLRESLLKSRSSCRVCALGGLMASCTLFNNEVNVAGASNEAENFVGGMGIGEAIRSNEKIGNGLTELFDRKQLALIENAYEKGDGFFGYGSSETIGISPLERKGAIKFGRKYSKNEDRLRAIMQNIIDNKGTFKP